MFGRILSIEIFDQEGQTTYLVDPLFKGNQLMCSGTIEYLPSSSGAPRATIQVYNLPSTLANPIFAMNKQVANEETGEIELVEDPKLLRVSFGYEDENDGELSTIFVGKIARAFTTRQDATTTITKIYAYQISDFYTSAVSTAQFDAGTTLYECVETLFKNSTVQGLTVQIPESLRGYRIDSSISFYGKTLDSVNSLLKRVNYMLVTTPMGINITQASVNASEIDAVILGSYDDTGKVVARSGLIGFPCIDTEGMRFETLINPRITLYSFVWLPNSIIIDEREGFTASNQFGATYDPAGLYRITKMTTTFNAHGGECKTAYIAISAGVGSKFYK